MRIANKAIAGSQVANPTVLGDNETIPLQTLYEEMLSIVKSCYLSPQRCLRDWRIYNLERMAYL